MNETTRTVETKEKALRPKAVAKHPVQQFECSNSETCQGHPKRIEGLLDNDCAFRCPLYKGVVRTS